MNKKVLLFVVLLIFLNISSTLATPFELYGKILLTSDIYESFSDKSNRIVSVPEGTKVKIIDTNFNHEWLKISTNKDYKGWIKSSSVEVIKNTFPKFTYEIPFEKNSKQAIFQPIDLVVKKNNIYVLDSYNYNFFKLDFDGTIQRSLKIEYPWYTPKDNYEDIVFTVDNNENIYTNSKTSDTIFKYNKEGKFILDFGSKQFTKIKSINYDSFSNSLYVLDSSQKNIKVFTEDGELKKIIFLSHIKEPEKIEINSLKKIIYVLDNEGIEKGTPVYFVKAYSLNVREEGSIESKIKASLPCGTILKILEEGLSKKDNYTWVKVLLPDNTQGYVAFEFLQKVFIKGKIQVYDFDGNYKEEISFDSFSLLIKNPESYENNYIYGKTNRYISDFKNEDNKLYLLLVDQNNNFKYASIYTYEIGSSNYFITKPITIGIEKLYKFNTDFIFIDRFKTLQIYDRNGILKKSLFEENSKKLLFPKALTIDSNNNIFVLDEGKNTIEVFKSDGSNNSIYINHPETDIWGYYDIVVNNKNQLFLIKYLQTEETIIGVIKYDLNSNEILYEDFIASLNNYSIPPKLGIIDDLYFLSMNSNFLGKETKFILFNSNNLVIKTYQKYDELKRFFSQDFNKYLILNNMSLEGIDGKNNLYMNIINSRTYKSSLYRIELDKTGKADIITQIDYPLLTNDQKNKNINLTQSDIETLCIDRDSNGFIYILYKNRKSDFSIVIYEPTGMYWGEIKLSLKNPNCIKVDNNGNIWVLDQFNLYKFIHQ